MRAQIMDGVSGTRDIWPRTTHTQKRSHIDYSPPSKCVLALWPIESPAGYYGDGRYIGLMQVDVTIGGMNYAWNWQLNAAAGLSTLQQKLQNVGFWETGMHKFNPGLPPLTGRQKEQNALIEYGGFLRPGYSYYWVPGLAAGTATVSWVVSGLMAPGAQAYVDDVMRAAQ